MARTRTYICRPLRWLGKPLKFDFPRMGLIIVLFAVLISTATLIKVFTEGHQRDKGITCAILDERRLWITALRGLGLDAEAVGLPLAPSPTRVDRLCSAYLGYNGVHLPPPPPPYFRTTTSR